MAQRSPIRTVIHEAIDLVERHGLPITPENVRANIKYDSLTLANATDALKKHTDAQVPLVMKERGLVITDTKSRERKDFWLSAPEELEEQLRIKQQSSQFDRAYLAADEAVVTFLKEQRKTLGYPVYPGLFHADVDRIYRMHGVTPPAA